MQGEVVAEEVLLMQGGQEVQEEAQIIPVAEQDYLADNLRHNKLALMAHNLELLRAIPTHLLIIMVVAAATEAATEAEAEAEAEAEIVWTIYIVVVAMALLAFSYFVRIVLLLQKVGQPHEQYIQHF